MATNSGQIKNMLGYIVPVVVVVIAYLAFKVVGQGEPPVRRAIKQVQLELSVTAAVDHQDALLLAADGVVVPFREIQLATQVAGRIAQKSPLCRPGNYVQQGQELFRIDDRDYLLEVRRLSKQLEQSTLQMEEVDLDIRNVGELIDIAKEDLALQLNEYTRLKRLEDGQVITATDVERAQRGVLAS